MATAPVGQHVAGPSSHSSTDTTDPITKFKILVPHLKESLQVHVEYENSVWCPYKIGDSKEIEKIQESHQTSN